MIVFFAGAKEQTVSEPFSDPRVAIGEELSLMTTFFDLKKGLKGKKRLRFFKGLKRRKKTGDSGKEFWRWIPGHEGEFKYSNLGRVRVIMPIKELQLEPKKILSLKESQEFIAKLNKKKERKI